MTLPWHQAIFHRDELRAARYAALADAEGFLQVCIALEALGLQLSKRQENLGKYGAVLRELASASTVLSEMSGTAPEYFSSFDALYETVRRARNDAMTQCTQEPTLDMQRLPQLNYVLAWKRHS